MNTAIPAVELGQSVSWIRLELVPLPESDLMEKVLFWNPDTEELLGEGVEEVLGFVEDARQAGHISGSMLSHFEITRPLSKPSELAAILAQHFWVIPEPVKQPGLVVSEDENAVSSIKH